MCGCARVADAQTCTQLHLSEQLAPSTCANGAVSASTLCSHERSFARIRAFAGCSREWSFARACFLISPASSGTTAQGLGNPALENNAKTICFLHCPVWKAFFHFSEIHIKIQNIFFFKQKQKPCQFLSQQSASIKYHYCSCFARLS